MAVSLVAIAGLTGCASVPVADSGELAGPSAAPPDDAPQALTLTVEPDAAAPSESVDLVLVHRDGSDFEYGLSYELERRSGGTWSPYDVCEGTPCDFQAVAILADGQARQTISAPSQPGIYRVRKSVSGLGSASAEFEVVERSD